jgi:hypothetical protein
VEEVDAHGAQGMSPEVTGGAGGAFGLGQRLEAAPAGSST